MVARLLLSVLLSMPAAAQASETFLGHGGLTVGVDSEGMLRTFRWPGPGSPNQLALDSRDPDIPGGARWEIELDGRWVSFEDSGATTRQEYDSSGRNGVATSITWPARSMRITQHDFLSAEQGTFVSRITLEGVNEPPPLRWRSDFSPTTKRVPQIPMSVSAVSGLADFMGYTDGERVWQFRPDDVSRAVWQRAMELAELAVIPDRWSDAGSGVWIAVQPGPGVRSIQVLGNPNARHDGIVVGDACAIVEPELHSDGETHTTWITVACGMDQVEAREALMLNPSQDPLELHDADIVMPEVERIRNRLRGFDAPAVERLAAASFLCRDRDSGRFVRSPAVQPNEARDFPGYGAWIAVGLDALRFRGLARERIAAYLEAIRVQDAPRRPYGSMPESFYADGTEASPHYVVDLAATARVLWATDRLSIEMIDADRGSFLAHYWDAIVAGAEFLVAWRDPRSGVPLWSPDPLGYADPETRQLIFDAYAGMSGALRLANVRGEAAPAEWGERWLELRSLIESILDDEANPWDAHESFLYECEGLDASRLTRIADVLGAHSHFEESRDGVQYARFAVQHVLVAQALGADGKLNPIELNLLAQRTAVRFDPSNGGRMAGRPQPADAYAAALMLFALAEASSNGTP